MADIKINPELLLHKDIAKKVVESQSALERMKVERGWVGQFWGASSSIPNNIAAFAIVLLLISGLVYTLMGANQPAEKVTLSVKDFWSIISPLITLAIGYLFGDKKGKPEGEPN